VERSSSFDLLRISKAHLAFKEETAATFADWITLGGLCALSTVFLFPSASPDGQTETGRILAFIMIVALMMFGLGITLIIGKSFLFPRLNTMDIVLLLIWAWVLLRASLAADFLYVVDALLKLSLMVLLYYFFKVMFWRQMLLGDPHLLFGAIGMVLVAGIFQAILGTLELALMDPHSPSSAIHPGGTLGNADALGSYLAPLAVVGVGMRSPKGHNGYFPKYLRHLGTIAVLLIIALLPATRERASWLAFAGGFAFHKVAWRGLFRENQGQQNAWAKKCSIVAGFLALVIVTGFLLYKMKPESADGRVLIWKTSATMFLANPLVGIGVDRFGVDYDSYQANYFQSGQGTERDQMLADHTLSAHNELIQILVEVGSIGGSLVVAFFVFALRSPPCNGARTIGLTRVVTAALVAFLMTSLFSISARILPSLLNATIFLSIISGQLSTATHPLLIQAKWTKALSPLILIVACGLLWRGHALNTWLTCTRDAEIAQEARHFAQADSLFACAGTSGVESGRTEFLRGSLFVQEGNISGAVTMLERARDHFNDPHLWILLGHAFESVRSYAQAEYCYERASNIVPAQIYPKYVMMQMYIGKRDFRSAIKEAQRIRAQPVKVASVAITEMKEEARLIIDSSDCLRTARK
jgi:O-antigen polymerase